MNSILSLDNPQNGQRGDVRLESTKTACRLGASSRGTRFYPKKENHVAELLLLKIPNFLKLSTHI